MNKETALKNLVDIRDILTSLNIRYFLTDGTFLGAVREQDFIEYDTDTDLGVFAEDITYETLNELKTILADKGFELAHAFGDFVNNYEVSFVRDYTKTDLFFYRKQGNKRAFHAFYHNNPITYGYPAELIENLEPIEFLGETFMAPSPEILSLKYGDWQTPKADWDWAFSPLNVINPKTHLLTVGCFDTLHEGHINLFDEMAKRIGWTGYNNPFFHVMIHDDLSIFKNKGRFPVQTAGHRRYNLEQLGIFPIMVGDKDPSAEIRKFAQQHENIIYIRGNDWQDFPGKKTLVELGIPIEFIEYTKGVSSSQIRRNL